MSNPTVCSGEKLFQQIIQESNRLEAFIASKNWNDAAKVERERYSLLQQLASIQGVTKSAQYAAFLRQAIDFIKAKQPNLEKELSESQHSLRDLGQKRFAVSKYQDISLT